MEFSVSRYAYVTMRSIKLVSTGEMELSSGYVIPELE